MYPSQSASFPRKQISSCRQCWLLTQFFKQKIVLNAVNSAVYPRIPECIPILPRLRYLCGGSHDPNDPQSFVDRLGYQTTCSGELRVACAKVRPKIRVKFMGLCESLLAFYVLYFCSHQNIFSQSTNQSREGFPVFELRSQGSYLSKGKSTRNEVK